MGRTVRVLRVMIVEDSLSDSLNVLRELEEGGYELRHRCVDTEDAMQSALEEEKWDLVIADYDVEGFPAQSALELIKKKGIRVPFILLADFISDDVAVSAVQAGVEEIIMKSTLTRLVPAVERVLGEKGEDSREQRPAQGIPKEKMGRLSGFIESSTEAVISTNREGELVLFNHGAEAMLRYQRQEVVGRPLSVLCESEEQVQEMMRHLKEGGMASFETVLRAKDGGSVPVMLSASILYDEDGQEAGIVGICEDNRERKKAEETKQRYARQKAAVAQFVSLAHKEVGVEHLMDAAAMLTGEALGVDYCDILELVDSGERLRLVSGVGWPRELVGSATVANGTDTLPGYTLAKKKPVIVEDLALAKKQFKGPSLLREHGVVSSLCVPMASGELVFGVMGAHSRESRDFSDDEVNFLEAVSGLLTAAVLRKRAKEELERASDELSRQVKHVERAQEQLIRAEKSAVVDRLTAGVSHEILNPLNVISLRLQMMNKDPSLPPDMLRHLQALEEQASRITKNIRDLLYYARKRAPEYRPMNLNETVTRILKLLEDELGKDKITLELRLAESLPPVLADADQIEQVVINLLNNAREAMPEGGKLVLSTGSVQENGHNFIEFKVKDSGEGVAPEDLDKLFDPFSTDGAEGEGAGLGLYVCQTILEAHGGRIKAESEKGSGTTVAFQLPLGQGKDSTK